MMELMRDKLIRILVVLSVFLALVAFGGIKVLIEQNNRLKQEKTRLETNITGLTTELKKSKDENGNLMVEVVALKMSKSEVEKIKDKEIQKLVNQAKVSDIRIKDLEFALLTNYSIIVDTVIEPVIVFESGSPIKMLDTIQQGESHIYRNYDFIKNEAKYDIKIAGNIYGYYEGMKKQGKWRFINIFVPRDRLPVMTLVSDNKWLDFNSIKFVVLKKD